jgi:hypothetical protein
VKFAAQIFCVFGLWALGATNLHAQRTVPADTTRPKNEKPFNPADTVAAALASKRITPARAFVRSLLVPGWGQFSMGATLRGSIYASLQGASAVMLAKTQIKISDARNDASTLRKTAVDSLIAFAQARKDTALIRKYSNPDSVTEVANTTFAVADKESLVKARVKQREDWITYFLFFTLASGVDAFVGAHLSDFPGTVTAEPIPAGGMRLRLDFPLGGRPPARAQPAPAPHSR